MAHGLIGLALAGSMLACNKSTPADKGKAAAGATTPAAVEDIVSKDILARTDTAKNVFVKHVLFGYKDAPALKSRPNPKAKDRDEAAAVKLAKETLEKLKAKPELIDELAKTLSEDPGAQSGDPYEVDAETPFVPEFKNLALRLKEKEVGVVKTDFGYHVIERIAAPAPDPLEPADILARPEGATKVHVQHVLIGWKDVPAAKSRGVDPRAQARDKAAADKQAQEVLAKIKAGEDMVKLMKEFSEDPGSKDTGKAYEVEAQTPFVKPFKALALRLNEGEAAMIRSPFGWHVMKRIAPPPPPPPDALESADILKRAAVTEKAKVKHILLSSQETGGSDERGKKRTRKELEALVKKTLKDLKSGKAIEPLMTELSEDPGSAKSGEGYDVTPDAGLVAPFKNLSLRLNLKEAGVVKSEFGFHIIQRVE